METPEEILTRLRELCRTTEGSPTAVDVLVQFLPRVITSMVICTCVAYDQPWRAPEATCHVTKQLKASWRPGSFVGKTVVTVMRETMFQVRDLTEDFLDPERESRGGC